MIYDTQFRDKNHDDLGKKQTNTNTIEHGDNSLFHSFGLKLLKDCVVSHF